MILKVPLKPKNKSLPAWFNTTLLNLTFRGCVTKNRTVEERRKTYFLLFHGCLGFAVLAKGPMGVLLPGLIIGQLRLCKGQLRFLKEMEMGWGLLIFLMIAAPWYVLIS